MDPQLFVFFIMGTLLVLNGLFGGAPPEPAARDELAARDDRSHADQTP